MPKNSQSDNKNIIRKSFPAFIENKQDDNGNDLGIVGAFVAVMGNIDYGDDIIAQGAFKKTISERASKIRVLDNHNSWSAVDAVGKLLSIRETTRNELPTKLLEEYPDATGGLYVEIQFMLDEPSDESAKIFRRIKYGVISEYSIGFEIIKDEYTQLETTGGMRQVRVIKEIRLWEVSPVIFAMNPATTTVGAKNLENAKVSMVNDYDFVITIDGKDIFDDSELTPDERREAFRLAWREFANEQNKKQEDTYTVFAFTSDRELKEQINQAIEAELIKELHPINKNSDSNYRMASDDSMCMNCRAFHGVTKNLGYCKAYETTVTANYTCDDYTPKAVMLSENLAEMMLEMFNSMTEKYSFLGVWQEDDIKIIQEMQNSLIEAFLGLMPETLIAREMPSSEYQLPKNNDNSELDTKAESDNIPLTPDKLKKASQRIAEIQDRMYKAKRKKESI